MSHNIVTIAIAAACQNLLDATYRDGELTFANGDIYLVTLLTYT